MTAWSRPGLSSAPATARSPGLSPEVRLAYGACRRMQRRHDPTYYWATRRLPPEIRPAVHALYGFVRGADELVDGADRPSDPAARRRALDDWQAELERGRASGRSRHPVIAALVDAGRRHELPLSELSIYMDSMRLDCGPVRVANRAELDRYMRGSAGAVGMVMAPLLDTPTELHPEVARLGSAFQLANFIRDVTEDYALDRIYLPADELARHGVSVEDIAQRRSSDGLRSLLAAEVDRARSLFASSKNLDRVLPASVRPGVHVARSVYERILDRIEALDFDILASPVRVPPWQLAGVAVSALARGGRRRA
ncbi:MAG: phytoene/squalene synthase family protein [Actinomycetota bacterium]|nr:phytoene/squalene synthase family protein [Actinomycetota bacterium]